MGDVDLNVLRTLDFNQPSASQPSLLLDSPTSSVNSIGYGKMQDASLFESPSSKQLATSQIFPTSANGNSTDKVCNSLSALDLNRSLHGENTEPPTSLISGGHMAGIPLEAEDPRSSSQTTVTNSQLWSVTSMGTVNMSEDNLTSSHSPIKHFQQYPSSYSSSVYNNGSGSMVYPSQPSQQTAAIMSHQGRAGSGRAITGHSSNTTNYSQPQQNMLMNTHDSNHPMMPNWNATQQTQWCTSQSQSSLYAPWNVQQHRSVPNVNALTSKKQAIQPQLQQSAYLAPTNFRRSTSFPGQIQQAAINAKNSYEMPAVDDVISYQHQVSKSFHLLNNCILLNKAYRTGI